ncbi:hypothetical protein A3Q56_03798 [Intoshia linei]|uniref:Uncharacterized protein n=1 Tax=Intoshia linei TaxID=1819745 RepID=A0A177B2D8_9BILA|nr:hypothetical protein A3Q56_03798 [Intoshia linei]
MFVKYFTIFLLCAVSSQEFQTITCGNVDIKVKTLLPESKVEEFMNFVDENNDLMLNFLKEELSVEPRYLIAYEKMAKIPRNEIADDAEFAAKSMSKMLNVLCSKLKSGARGVCRFYSYSKHIERDTNSSQILTEIREAVGRAFEKLTTELGNTDGMREIASTIIDTASRIGEISADH